MTGECGFAVDGSSELGNGFFNHHVYEKESQVNFFSKAKRRRVKQVTADVSEKIALIFVAKYYESVIHIAVIHLRLESGLEKFRFIVASKNIAWGWSDG